MLNDLHEAMRTGKARALLEPLINDLIAFTDYHFSTEEDLMMAYGYPEYEQHKEEHQQITKQVIIVHNNFYNEDYVSVTIHLVKLMTDWLSEHLLGTDMKYTSFLNSKGIK